MSGHVDERAGFVGADLVEEDGHWFADDDVAVALAGGKGQSMSSRA